ncbi:hypothetical protein JCM10207_004297 [Rhodosporidiobolus poonsookiae]
MALPDSSAQPTALLTDCVDRASWKTPLLSFRPEALPPLPDISDSKLATLARTHKTSVLDYATRTQLDDHAAELISNERVEWVGDGILHGLMTQRLAALMPVATSGFLSHRTLSHLAVAYDLPKQLIVGPSKLTRRDPSGEQKTAAYCFEAHLGAVFQNNQAKGGFETLKEYISRLVTPTVFPELGELIDEMSRPASASVVGEKPTKKRRIETPHEVTDAQRGGPDGQRTRFDRYVAHEWEDSFLPERKWRSTLRVQGNVLAMEEGTKVATAREAALDVHFLGIFRSAASDKLVRDIESCSEPARGSLAAIACSLETQA